MAPSEGESLTGMVNVALAASSVPGQDGEEGKCYVFGERDRDAVC